MIKAVLAAMSLVFLASCASTPQVTPAARAELAPTGKLRVGINFGNTLLTRKEPATGAAGGIAVDLAHELGRRLAVPVEIVPFGSAGQMANAVKTGAWDVAFLGAEPQRAKEINFTAPYAEIESTYLVPAGSKLRNVADADREGVRIAVAAKSAYDLYLSRNLQRAKLERAPGIANAFKLFVAERMDALTGLKPVLLNYTAKLPGSRVLDGRFSVVGQAIGTPAGRDAGAKYLGEFVEDVKASGLAARTIEKNGVRGVSVAPPAQGASSVSIGGGYY